MRLVRRDGDDVANMRMQCASVGICCVVCPGGVVGFRWLCDGRSSRESYRGLQLRLRQPTLILFCVRFMAP
jgi:hypothetical protein